MKKASVWLIASSALVILLSCTKERASDVMNVYPVSIRLMDDPGLYDAVLLDIRLVEVNTDATTDKGWYPLTTQPGIFNLTKLQNGIDTMIASTQDLAPGRINQIRLVLGNENAVVVGGIKYPLTLMNAKTNFTIDLKSNLSPNIPNTIILDVDANRSIVTNNGAYILQPILRAAMQSESGSIKGGINPVNSKSMIYAVLGNDTASAITDEHGHFQISGLMPNSYQLIIRPALPYTSKTIAASVVKGQVNDIGVISLY